MHRPTAARQAGSAAAELKGSMASADAVSTRSAPPRKLQRAQALHYACRGEHDQSGHSSNLQVATPPGVPKTPNFLCRKRDPRDFWPAGPAVTGWQICHRAASICLILKVKLLHYCSNDYPNNKAWLDLLCLLHAARPRVPSQGPPQRPPHPPTRHQKRGAHKGSCEGSPLRKFKKLNDFCVDDVCAASSSAPPTTRVDRQPLSTQTAFPAQAKAVEAPIKRARR